MRSPVMAGRCACGVRLDLVEQDPDAHLICHGLKVCCACLEAKPLEDYYEDGHGRRTGRCKPCKNARATIVRRQRYRRSRARRGRVLAGNAARYWADPEFFRLKAQARREAHGVRYNANRRQRYAEDAAYRQRRLESGREYKRQRRALRQRVAA